MFFILHPVGFLFGSLLLYYAILFIPISIEVATRRLTVL